VSWQDIEAAVQSAIQQASLQTGVPAEVLQFIHEHEVVITAQGPNQGTFTNSSNFGGFFGLPSNLLHNGDPTLQALTTADLLKSYGASDWQTAIKDYNVGPGGSLGNSYAASYPGGGSAPPSGGSSAGAGVTSGAPPSSAPTASNCQDWQLPGGITLAGTHIFCSVGNFFAAGGWGKLLLSIVGAGLIIGGSLVYFKGDLPKAVPVPV
jgi:hypothetical protein